MRFKLLLATLLLAISQLSFAQFTQVSGTVQDSIGLPYANGTITAVLNIHGTPIITATNQPYTPPTGLVQLDVNGNFSMQLAANSALSPGGSSWTFITCSAIGTANPSWGKASACYSEGPLTISGSTQNISRELQNNAIPLTYSASIILQDSPSCATLDAPVEIDTTHLDVTGKVTAQTAAQNSATVKGIAVAVPASGCIGSVQVATGLVVPCVTSNQSAVGDFVAADVTSCIDIGSSSSNISFAQVMRANTGPGTVSMILLELGGGGTGTSASFNCPGAVNGALGAFQSPSLFGCDNNSLTDFAGHLSSQSYQSLGPFNAEELFTTIGVVPPAVLPSNTLSWVVPNVVPTSTRLNMPLPGTDGQIITQLSHSVDASGTPNIFFGLTNAGSGTVTSITATSPIVVTPTPLTGVGVISCPTCGTSAATVTSFSSGNLPPLFTTSVANPTTTPALSFSLSNAAAFTVLGNNTSGSAAPTYFAMQGTDTKVLSSGTVSGTGLTLCTDANGGATTSGCPNGGGSNKVSFDQWTPAQTGGNAGNSFWTVQPYTNWDSGHWEWTCGSGCPHAGADSSGDLYGSIRVPSNISGTLQIVIDLSSADTTNGHTETYQTCDAVTTSRQLQVGVFTCAATQNYSSTTTAFSNTELTFNVQSTAIVDEYLLVKIHHSASGTATSNVLMQPPKLKVF